MPKPVGSALVSVGGGNGQTVTLSGDRNHPEFLWVNAEAKRRNVPVAQVARDAFRAYRKLVKDAAKIPVSAPDKTVINVKF